ncbi:glycine cleavage system protein GcvH [Planctomicrobium piriforme]|uniref:Glycine cleavage system H protein n=1 Tax=Planctomicrobium piriforme TaxID=1576369 RepID=A0A1I3F989_9PLAN|nr:glycine cleavage system protein GcvH [Planctomicrobium piriforme]SFI07814.1 glycine cleavage system H protein [Planctomicrobium piriforme]
MNPSQLKFAKTHEWVSVEGQIATIGISDFAVKELTDVVHLEFPQTGKTVSVGDEMGEIESVKAVSDLYAPVSGKIVALNSALQGDLSPLSDDPFGAGWILKIELSNPGDVEKLMSYADYQKECESH